MGIVKSVTAKNDKTIVYDTLKKMKRVLEYINDLEKTEPELRGGVFLNNPDKAFEEFMLVKNLWNKQDKGKRKCIHLIQSFAPGEGTPLQIKKIAEEFVKHQQFEGFQISYAVHTDRDHLHTHFVINTVNVENGRMWQMSKRQFQNLKDYSDSLCKEHGLTVLDNSLQKGKHKSPAQEKAELNGTSWKKETQLAVDEAVKIATSRADFISIMKLQGYSVRWDERKHILFTNAQGKSMRNRLFDNSENYTKEALENKFVENSKVQDMQPEEVPEEISDYDEKDESFLSDQDAKPEEMHKTDNKTSEKQQEDFSYIRRDTFYAVRDAKNVATSKDEFISILNSQGYNVRWDEHKYITFTKPGHRAVRNRNFYPKDAYTKEALLKKFEQNQQKMERIKNGKYQEMEMSDGERTRGDLLYLLTHLFSGNKSQYPHQDRIRSRSAEAIKDWQKEQEKGKGMDWE